ncbi:MAG TPA: potassium/proton antiporter [Thermoanaerobaculia bacterium]|nr:potassium/proton antiporter [Thermoanaerobaculia bacterium]
MTLEQVLAGIAILLFISVFASKASGRLGVPALILFLGLGILAGSEGLGGIYFDDAGLAQRLGVVALIFILFAGGMETDWLFVRSVVARSASLATLGVLLTSLVVGWFAHRIAGLSLLEGMLLGAIVSSTDAAAVFSILRSRGVRLRRDVAATLELESGSNDPMAVFLTTAILQLMQTPAQPLLNAAIDFVRQMTFGAAVGLLFGWIAVRMLNRSRLEYQGLYPVMTVALVLFTYAATALIGGNGFLAVYLLGISMARTNFVQRRTLTKFHDGIAWLMQIAMFITLGLLVFPSQLPPVAGVSLVMAVVLMFVARPVAVFISTAAARMTLRERLLVSWVGLRGAVPIILATFPLVAGIPAAGAIFNIVFFIVFASVILQGTTIAMVARWLGLDTAVVEDYSPAVAHLAGRGESAMITLEVPKGSRAAGKRVVELGWPRQALILVIYRGNEFFVPNGATMLAGGDRLIVLTSTGSVDQLRSTLEPQARANINDA